MTLQRFLLYIRFATQRPEGISINRWNAMVNFARKNFAN